MMMFDVVCRLAICIFTAIKFKRLDFQIPGTSCAAHTAPTSKFDAKPLTTWNRAMNSPFLLFCDALEFQKKNTMSQYVSLLTETQGSLSPLFSLSPRTLCNQLTTPCLKRGISTSTFPQVCHPKSFRGVIKVQPYLDSDQIG